MNPVIDQMLALTADIAEELLLIKDAERDTLPDGLKLKIISLAELAATSDGAQPQEDTAVEENVAVTEDDAAEIENAEFEEEADADVNLAEEQPETEETPTVQEEKELYEEDKEMPDSTPEITPESDCEPIEEPEPAEEPEPVEESGPASEHEPEPEPTPESTLIQAIVEEVETPRRNISPTDIYRTFSINDAFFYRREIFGGSRQQMMESLVQISMLPDRAALREYLVERLGLNLDETPGKEFYQSLEALL